MARPRHYGHALSYTINLQPRGLVFKCEKDQTLMDAAEHAGIRMRKSCDNGVCEVCKARLISGYAYKQGQHPKQHFEQGSVILPCVSKANSDIILEQFNVLAPGEISTQHLSMQIESVQPLNDFTYEVKLLAPAGKIPQYHAGQYLELLIGDNQYPFTIASKPNDRHIELHLGVSDDNASSLLILDYLKSNSTVRVKLPGGTVWLKPGIDSFNLHDPLIFVVAGTGFAQAKAMIEEQLTHQHSAIFLYWINRNESGFYSDLPETWHKQHLIHYHPMTPEQIDGPLYSPENVESLIHKQVNDMSKIRVVACGSPNFVYSILDGLEGKGFEQSQMLSDVFAYAPRPSK